MKADFHLSARKLGSACGFVTVRFKIPARQLCFTQSINQRLLSIAEDHYRPHIFFSAHKIPF